MKVNTPLRGIDMDYKMQERMWYALTDFWIMAEERGDTCMMHVITLEELFYEDFGI